jgi:hypothetical protein
VSLKTTISKIKCRVPIAFEFQCLTCSLADLFRPFLHIFNEIGYLYRCSLLLDNLKLSAKRHIYDIDLGVVNKDLIPWWVLAMRI